MICELWQDKIDAYLDAELPREEMAEVASHLQACGACATQAVAHLHLKLATRDAGRRYDAPAALRVRVRAELEPRGARRPRFVFWPVAVAVAAVVVIAVSAALLLRRDERRAAGELVDLHVATLASSSPVDVVSTDRHTVRPWFEGRIPFSFDLPALDGTPFTLIGARLAYLRQSPGAHLIYAYQKHRISVFVFRDAPALGFAGGVRSDTSFQVISWERNGLRFAAVTDTSADVAVQLRDLFQSAR